MIWYMEILRTYIEGRATHKVLRDKAFNIAKNSKYYRYQRGLLKGITKNY